MIDKSKIPPEGYLLAYSYLKLVFDRYSLRSRNIVLHKDNSVFMPEDFYEIHCFDNEKEYRVFHKKSGDVETVVSADEEFENDESFVYTEEQYLDEKYCPFPEAKIIVKNHFKFNEDDCLYLDNYRLACAIHDDNK